MRDLALHLPILPKQDYNYYESKGHREFSRSIQKVAYLGAQFSQLFCSFILFGRFNNCFMLDSLHLRNGDFRKISTLFLFLRRLRFPSSSCYRLNLHLFHFIKEPQFLSLLHPFILILLQTLLGPDRYFALEHSALSENCVCGKSHDAFVGSTWGHDGPSLYVVK
jgi:hypothetical protein